MNESLEAAREAALTNPDDADAHARFGRACLEAGDLARAIESLQRAARLAPEDAAIRTALGRAWLAAADPEKAVFHLRRAAALDPEDGDVRNLLARAESAPPELSPDFVRALFDQYAETFDAEMAGLSYRAPEALRATVARVLDRRLGAPHEARLDVLDLGCGTGLAGLAFRAWARALTGVDLSPRMVEKARARGVYDRLVVGDMTRTMRDSPAAFDLILAADALGYLGDLAPLLSAARAALRPRGHFAASVEEGADVVVRFARASPPDFALGPARRFRHRESYVRRAALAAGFTVAALERRELRQDRGAAVAGLVFVLGVP
jgi:predicted TPR repeat methyltransferase